MIRVRKAGQRGHDELDWLDTWFSFSFADYHDPRHMGFSDLRVINQDRIAPERGFQTHGHRDMEILTYLLVGELAHADSEGSSGRLRPGDVQVMSAGRGIQHSEVNPSPDEACHLLQIWILPARSGAEPRYDQRHFPIEERRNRLRLLASGGTEHDALRIGQDARVFGSVLGSGQELAYAPSEGRRAWLQLARGRLLLNGVELASGDGAAIEDEPALAIQATQDAELLLFDLR